MTELLVKTQYNIMISYSIIFSFCRFMLIQMIEIFQQYQFQKRSPGSVVGKCPSMWSRVSRISSPVLQQPRPSVALALRVLVVAVCFPRSRVQMKIMVCYIMYLRLRQRKRCMRCGWRGDDKRYLHYIYCLLHSPYPVSILEYNNMMHSISSFQSLDIYIDVL